MAANDDTTHLNQRPDWHHYREALVWDGALRDISVVGTTLGDWQQFIDVVHINPYVVTFAVDQTPTPLPARAEDVFRIRSVASPVLTIDCVGVVLWCHFLTEDEIELSFDPREVQDEAAFSAVTSFMSRLSRLLHKPASLTFENDRTHPILRVEPTRPT